MHRLNMNLMAVVGMCGATAAAREFQLALTVREPAGIERIAEPTSGGIPLEQDNVEALLPAYLRSGQRGYVADCEAWADLTLDHNAWRTDGWRFKDGVVFIGGACHKQRKEDPVRSDSK